MKYKCPICGSDEFYDFLYTYYICCECRALLEIIPFNNYLKIVSLDASIKYPEILNNIEWNIDL